MYRFKCVNFAFALMIAACLPGHSLAGERKLPPQAAMPNLDSRTDSRLEDISSFTVGRGTSQAESNDRVFEGGFYNTKSGPRSYHSLEEPASGVKPSKPNMY